MRLGVAWAAYTNAFYRAIDPMKAMERRGHQVIWPEGPGKADLRQLSRCDVVHVYRASNTWTRQACAQLMRGGTAVVYDNDDDMTAIPKQSLNYKTVGGLKGQRVFLDTVKLARAARRFTTTTEVLADRYRQAGVKNVGVIGNYLAPDSHRPKHPHDGVVIGWIAAGEHQADADLLDIAAALKKVAARHENVRVECIGIDLGLRERYTHTSRVNFTDLPSRMGGFDIGIAPMADIPMNRARSDIKLKEYAASGVAWLASPVGAYIGLGEQHGGRLVPDDGWFDALDRLVSDHRDRQRLARNGEAWAKTQTIEAVADRWEHLFADVAGGKATSSGGAPTFTLPSGTSVQVRLPKRP